MIHDHYTPTVAAIALATVEPALVDLVETVDLYLCGIVTRSELQRVWRQANIVVHPAGAPLEPPYDADAFRALGAPGNKVARPWFATQTVVAV